MKKLSFFDVPAEYVNFLRKYEMDIRGFSRVPLVDYEMHNRKGKFFCGIVLHINDYCYHVPVSSKIQEHSNTFFLYDRGLRIGSLRFDYMIPVPERVMEIRIVENERDIPYRRLMEKELAYCRAHTSEIREMALRTYMMVTLTGQRTEHLRLERSCDFRLLEGACDIYAWEHGLSQERLEPVAEMLRKERPRSLDEIIANAEAHADELNARRDKGMEKKNLELY